MCIIFMCRVTNTLGRLRFGREKENETSKKKITKKTKKNCGSITFRRSEHVDRYLAFGYMNIEQSTARE